ncbi:hypothetical protein QA612_11235 [Evansella sp. AB-P1]|uniref:hypothetical protein n=1 Tax=Evansella sp. AB-P1 TaxID=3037653 RepID=UPI00241EF7C7|nr:hypothetical protein [Evansella sp. AB-P1]MDG5788064.1 hypothetical protein [Evansella sp. AB-P1]
MYQLQTIIFLIGLIGEIFSTTTIKAHDDAYISNSNCYSTYFFYGGWNPDSNGNVNINYAYDQRGQYGYSNRILLGGNVWRDSFSFFNFSWVSPHNANAMWVSDDYGDVGWVGRAYYTSHPKELYLNEWYHKNWSS